MAKKEIIESQKQLTAMRKIRHLLLFIRQFTSSGSNDFKEASPRSQAVLEISLRQGKGQFVALVLIILPNLLASADLAIQALLLTTRDNPICRAFLYQVHSLTERESLQVFHLLHDASSTLQLIHIATV